MLKMKTKDRKTSYDAVQENGKLSGNDAMQISLLCGKGVCMCALLNVNWWRRGVAVTSLGVSTKLLCIGPAGMDDRLRRANHLSISPSHPGQLSLLPSAGREVSTSQSVVMLCGWGVNAGMVHSTCG